ncbi:MAG: hemerythrin domain-containing protein [Caldimonas sp.]
MDITQLILDDHHEQRRLFAILEQIDRGDTTALGAIWARLSAFLEVHAEAEERHFYPTLLRVGTGAGGRADAAAETEHAIKDHNEIRDAVAKVARHDVASESWFTAVAEANKANSEHMSEEELEGLADFRDNADVQLRHALAVAFATFEARHYAGVTPVDKDPKAYVEANK